MSIIRVIPCFAVLVASTAHAGALITLAPTNPGPYLGGETFPIDVWITADQNYPVRLLELDFSQTNPMIFLSGPDGPDADATPEFLFDFSSLTVSALYSTFANLPVSQIVYSGRAPIPGFTLNLPANQPFHAGSVGVTLPQAVGTYRLDAVNDSQYGPGAQIDFDFAIPSCPFWGPCNTVEISGGQFDFTVIPEPTTLILLTFGGLAVPSFRFRRNRQARLVTPSVYHRVRAMQMPCVPPIAPATGSLHCCS